MVGVKHGHRWSSNDDPVPHYRARWPPDLLKTLGIPTLNVHISVEVTVEVTVEYW